MVTGTVDPARPAPVRKHPLPAWEGGTHTERGGMVRRQLAISSAGGAQVLGGGLQPSSSSSARRSSAISRNSSGSLTQLATTSRCAARRSAPAWRSDRHGGQVLGAGGTGRVLLDGEVERRGCTAHSRVPALAQIASTSQCRARSAWPMSSRARSYSRSAAGRSMANDPCLFVEVAEPQAAGSLERPHERKKPLTWLSLVGAEPAAEVRAHPV
jgi:hypothetical protein